MSLVAILTLFRPLRGIAACSLCFALLCSHGLPMIPINMAQVSPGLDNISHPPFEFLCLGKAAVYFPIPQYFGIISVLDRNHKRPACGGLQCDFS